MLGYSDEVNYFGSNLQPYEKLTICSEAYQKLAELNYSPVAVKTGLKVKPYLPGPCKYTLKHVSDYLDAKYIPDCYDEKAIKYVKLMWVDDWWVNFQFSDKDLNKMTLSTTFAFDGIKFQLEKGKDTYIGRVLDKGEVICFHKSINLIECLTFLEDWLRKNINRFIQYRNKNYVSKGVNYTHPVARKVNTLPFTKDERKAIGYAVVVAYVKDKHSRKSEVWSKKDRASSYVCSQYDLGYCNCYSCKAYFERTLCFNCNVATRGRATGHLYREDTICCSDCFNTIATEALNDGELISKVRELY